MQKRCDRCLCVLLAPKGANKLATPLGKEDLAILINLSNSGDMSRCELDKDNNNDFKDELSPEDRQVMEDFMKKRPNEIAKN
jgi:hypothetical protein